MRRKMPAVLTTVVAVVVIQLTMSPISRSIVLFLLLKQYQCFNNYKLFIFDTTVIYCKFQAYQAKVESWCNEAKVAAILEPSLCRISILSLNSAKDDSKVIKVKRLNTEITLNERDVRVGSDAVLLDFWCGFAEFFLKLQYCGFTKPNGLRYLENFW